MDEEDPNIDEPRPLTHEEREVLTHALTGGRGKVYRNYYAVAAGSTYGQICRDLVLRGLMSATEGDGWGEPMFRYYMVTQAGAHAVGLHLP